MLLKVGRATRTSLGRTSDEDVASTRRGARLFFPSRLGVFFGTLVRVENRLIIFTRYPAPGTTKTRLIPSLGAEGAAALQRAMTEHAVRQALRANARVEVRYEGGSAERMREWLGSDIAYVEQGAGDLGERMARAFAENFEKRPGPVLIMGADCPTNDGKNLQDAFEALKTSDCVIGPATDGGYYLIGTKVPCPALFEGIEWGSAHVLSRTRAAAEAAGLSVHPLPELSDVDLPEDVPPRISVVIPTLGEEEMLSRVIGRCREGFGVEVIVADGGGADRSLEAAVGARVIEVEGGRAAQQNAGAKAADGDVLLFLHADTMLPERWDWIVREALSDPTVALGAFSFKVREEIRGVKFIEQTTNQRSRGGRMPYGDQGLFLRREMFEKVGGFPDLPIMEDYAIVRALGAVGEIVTVPEAAVTSGRRWLKHGVFKVTLVNKLMIAGYHLGVAPEKLARFYRRA